MKRAVTVLLLLVACAREQRSGAAPKPADEGPKTEVGDVMPAYTATRVELVQRAGDVLRWIADGSLDVRIGKRYPLREARQAHEDLEARRTTGKLLLVP